MIFVGDIALPYKEAININSFPKEFYNKNWFGNLEGGLIKDSDIKKTGVYNSYEAIRNLTHKINFKGFALANNHILDIGNLDTTIDLLNDLQVPFCGVGEDIYTANKELVIYDEGIEIVIINFGWEVIQCQVTTGRNAGVNPLIKNHVVQTVESLIKKYPKGKVLPFMHWGYELEGEPQPFERQLAKHLIDIGASGVIGCHSHRIGGFEMYKDKPILYSLGNWMFKQNYYHNAKLQFPEFCNNEIAFEWNFTTNEIKFHFFNYDKKESSVNYIDTEDVNSAKMEKFTPFRNLTDNDYKKWYKRNHYHKNKGLPIYYWGDSTLLVKCKNKINLMRDKLLSVYLKLR